MSLCRDQPLETIVAVSTPPGHSGIGLIRLSGPEAVAILQNVFRTSAASAKFNDRQAVYGVLHDPETGQVIDDGIAMVMRGPRSYTGEDVVELTLHGSPVVLDRAVALLVHQGARPARRGEFTRRAFISGRMDLVQAEAVADLIESTNAPAAQEARERLGRGLSNQIVEISHALKDIVADLEAHIDFDEDDEYPAPEVRPALLNVLERMESLKNDAESARLRREGLKAVILGKPNVGKSTLFNALIGQDRMIVTPYPGTTRDPVEEYLVVEGVPLHLCDTAGMREDPEPIEKEGIRRTRARTEDADIVLAVLDGSVPLDAADMAVLGACEKKTAVVVLNKVDLGLLVNPADPSLGPRDLNRLAVCAITGDGLAALQRLIADIGGGMVATQTLTGRAGLNRRCLTLLEAASIPVREALQRCGQQEFLESEILSLDLRRSIGLLEEITGERVDEGILDRIFERFCVGK